MEKQETINQKFWHSIEVDDVLKEFDSNAEVGLKAAEISDRQQKYGKNILTQKKGDGPIKRFFLQFHNSLLYVLIVSGFITLFLKQYPDCSVRVGF